MLKKSLPLILILILAFFLRFIALSSLPNSLHDDELDAGYIGRYIFLHGEDIKGNTWPIFYDKFGDFRPIGIFYLSAISTFLLGINEVGVRAPSALFGALSVAVIYFFVLELFRNKKVAIFSAILLALSPWHIVLSRATSEGVIGMFFLLFGIFLLVKGIHKDSKKYILVSFISLLGSYFLYHSYRLEVIIFLLPFVFYYGKKSQNRKIIIALIGVFVLLTIGIALSGWGSGRFNQIAFYKNPGLSNTIDSQVFAHKVGSPLDLLVTRGFHNKGIIYFRELITQYVSYFSPEFLFIKGGQPPRYFIPESGLFYLITIPLFLLGLMFLYQKESGFPKKYLLYLLITSPIVASLTFDESPNIHRALFLVIPFIIITSFGWEYTETFLKKKNASLARFLIYIVILVESMYFLHQYITHSPSYKSVLRNDGSKEVATFLIENKNNYDTIIVNNAYEMPLYYLFYKRDFTKLSKGSVGDHNRIQKLDNLTFTNESCPSKDLKLDKYKNKKILVIDNGDCEVPLLFEVVNKINRKDQTAGFTIITPVSISQVQ